MLTGVPVEALNIQYSELVEGNSWTLESMGEIYGVIELYEDAWLAWPDWPGRFGDYAWLAWPDLLGRFGDYAWSA